MVAVVETDLEVDSEAAFVLIATKKQTTVDVLLMILNPMTCFEKSQNAEQKSCVHVPLWVQLVEASVGILALAESMFAALLWDLQ